MRETRAFESEVRMEITGTSKYLVGRAASFGVLSHDLGGWREILAPGAFDDALSADDLDVVHTLNHDASKILGRTASGTTRLTSDSKGLHYRTLLPDVSYAQDLAALCERGDISASSFAFSVDPADEDWSETDDPDSGETVPLRTITRIAKLYDVATVAMPAYPGTAAGLSDRGLPATMPAELRSKILQRATDMDVDPNLDADLDQAAADDPCECDCSECEAGECAECSNPDCEDENCRDCPYASDRSRSLPGAGGDAAAVVNESNELALEEAWEEP